MSCTPPLPEHPDWCDPTPEHFPSSSARCKCRCTHHRQRQPRCVLKREHKTAGLICARACLIFWNLNWTMNWLRGFQQECVFCWHVLLSSWTGIKTLQQFAEAKAVFPKRMAIRTNCNFKGIHAWTFLCNASAETWLGGVSVEGLPGDWQA